MKHVFALLLLALNLSVAQAQNCNGCYLMQPGRTIRMAVISKAGRQITEHTYRVMEIQQKGPVMTSLVRGQSDYLTDKRSVPFVCHAKCNAGTYLLDMKLFLPEQQAYQFLDMNMNSEMYLEYPADLKTGDTLKDGTFMFDTKSEKGLPIHLELNVVDRRVLNQEEVTTPAGIWKCFKIVYVCKVHTRIAGVGIPSQIENTEWFAPDFGVVKTSSRREDVILTSIQ